MTCLIEIQCLNVFAMLDRFGQIGSYRLFSIKTASRLFNIADGHGVRGCGFLSFSDFTATKPVGVEGDWQLLRQSGKVVVVTVVEFVRGPAALCDEALGILANPTTF